MLFKRILTSILLIGMIALVVSSQLLVGLVVTLFIIGGLYEFFTMLEKKGIIIYKYFGIAIGTIIPLSIMFRFELTRGWELFFAVLGLLSLILMQFRRHQNSGVIVGISTTLFGILYVSWFFSFLIRIRHLEQGLGLLVTVLLITKLGDIGAYVVGSRLGKTPLMPRISPHKSVEGAAGGLLFSILGALIGKTLVSIPYPQLVLLGIFIGVLGEVGDLSESLMKRDCGVKDSGNSFPGIGGFQDLMDSLLFTAPVFYFLCSYVIFRHY